METLIMSGERADLRALLDSSSALKDLPYLREYAIIVHIDHLEEAGQSEQRFWKPEMSLQQLVQKVRTLKYKLKRLEYGAEDLDIGSIWRDHSRYAVTTVCDRYVVEKEKVYDLLNGYQADRKEEGIVPRDTRIEQIQDAITAEDYKRADKLLQDYMTGDLEYDDTVAILDAAIGSYHKDQMRSWDAIRKGLAYNCRNHELYVLLGEYYLQEDPWRTYLCFENALFYCDDPEDQKVIDGLLSQLQEEYKFFIHKTAIIIRPDASLEHIEQCVKCIRRTTPESARKIVIITDVGSQEKILGWSCGQDDVIVVDEGTGNVWPAQDGEGQTGFDGMDIFLLADDVLLTENALFWLRMGLYDKEENGAVGSVFNVRDNLQMADGVTGVKDLFAFGERTNIPQKYPYEEKIFLSGAALLVKCSVWEHFGPLDRSLGELRYEDFGLSVLTAGYRNILCKNSFVIRMEEGTVLEKDVRYGQILQEERGRLNAKWGFNTEYYLGARQDLPSLIDEPKEQPLNILEIGCGCGALLGYIKGIYPNTKAYGVELIPEVAKVAVHMGEVLCGDIEKIDLSWEEGYFDYIIMGDVLEHLMDPETVLKKLRKYLKIGGHIIVSMPNVKHYSVLLPLLRWDVFPYSDAGILDRTHVKMYTGTEIQKLIQKSGYRSVRMGYCSYSTPTEQEKKMLDILETFLEGPSKETFFAYQYVLKAVKR